MSYLDWPSKKERLGALYLDPKNPRLHKRAEPDLQNEIIAELVKKSNVREIASSIAADGYFPLKQMIAYKSEADSKKYVLEGNNINCQLPLTSNAQNCFQNLILPPQITLQIHSPMAGSYLIDNVTLHRKCIDFQYYVAHVTSAKDYYPFGMGMPGRSFTSEEYRYGFQGQEMDDEIKGDGNSINYKYRMHDTRLGRFFSVDPLAPKFAYNSPYAFSENRVIDGIELEGLEVVLIGKQVAMGAFVSGSSEGGVAIAPDGVYAYGSLAIGIETNASVASQISITFFPTMPSSKYAQGWGVDAGVAAGEFFVGSINVSLAEGDFKGINITFGVGASIIPADMSVYATWTELEPISQSAKETTLGILKEAKGKISARLDDLAQEKDDIMKNEDYDQKQVDALNNEISTMNEALEQVDKGIKTLSEKTEKKDDE